MKTYGARYCRPAATARQGIDRIDDDLDSNYRQLALPPITVAESAEERARRAV